MTTTARAAIVATLKTLSPLMPVNPGLPSISLLLIAPFKHVTSSKNARDNGYSPKRLARDADIIVLLAVSIYFAIHTKISSPSEEKILARISHINGFQGILTDIAMMRLLHEVVKSSSRAISCFLNVTRI